MAVKVINIGSANIDEIMSVAQLPVVGETKYTPYFERKIGGKGANQAVAVARAGGNSVFLGSVGMDSSADIIIEKLSDNGVNISHMLRMKGQQTGIAQVWTDGHENNMIICFPGASLGNEKEQLEILKNIAQKRDVFMITLEYSNDFVADAVKTAHARGCTVVLDPSGNLETAKERSIAGLVDIIKPNEVETEQLTGIEITDRESASAALEALENMGFKTPVISLGAKGCCARVDGEITFVETDKVNAVDTTGAGDAFLGYLTSMLAKGYGLEKSLRIANRAAAICTTKLGAAESVPFIKEICLDGIN